MISLTYLWLQSPEEATRRVAQRVIQGGHNISKETIIRRYYAGIKNLLNHYLPIADKAFILDNSSEKSNKRIIAKKTLNGMLDILDKSIWNKIEKVAYER